MNTIRSRFLLGNVVSNAVKMSTKAKKPSHYDTLEINSRATQNEIKTAYFKLSKQYHPDKNSSFEATEKFRDISEAYEILGNHNSRKVYDRSIITKMPYQKHRQTNSTVDPKIKYYQAQAAIFRDTQKSGSTSTYDFDAWTKAHYGKTFRRTVETKMESARRRESRIEDYSHNTNVTQDVTVMGIVAFILITACLWANINPSYDDFVPSHQRDQKISPATLSVERSQLSDVSTNSVSSK